MKYGVMTNEGLITVEVKADVTDDQGVSIAMRACDKVCDMVFNGGPFEYYSGIVPEWSITVWKSPEGEWEICESDE